MIGALKVLKWRETEERNTISEIAMALIVHATPSNLIEQSMTAIQRLDFLNGRGIFRWPNS